MTQVIWLRPEAPRQPAPGQPCNGCGVCCAAEPCPAGMLLSRRRRGACRALVWSAADGCYRCGLVQAPRQVLTWLPAAASPWVAQAARRWIAAATGCDASLVAESAAPGHG